MALRGWARTGILVAMGVMAALSQHGAAAADATLMAIASPPSEPLFGDQVAPTVGAALMCTQSPRDPFCRGIKQYRPLALDARTFQLIRTVNKAVNSEIEPVDDIVQWHVAEKWNRPARGADGRLQDDCDGYVIEKWYRLVVEAGLSPDGFYPLYAEIPGLGGHLVLAVMTTNGTYILDNLHEDLVPMTSFSFTYLKRPRPGNRLDSVWERYLAWGSGSGAPEIAAARN